MMSEFENTSQGLRRARVRSLIQLGTLMQKAGLLETFEISLGSDLQKDPEIKMPVAALFKGLLTLNAMSKSDDVHMPTWAEQGLAVFGKLKKENSKITES